MDGELLGRANALSSMFRGRGDKKTSRYDRGAIGDFARLNACTTSATIFWPIALAAAQLGYHVGDLSVVGILFWRTLSHSSV
jgi:hypothetical protein